MRLANREMDDRWGGVERGSDRLKRIQ